MPTNPPCPHCRWPGNHHPRCPRACGATSTAAGTTLRCIRDKHNDDFHVTDRIEEN